MPNRTDEARALIDSLPEKESDEKCNARTPNGYCRNPAGYATTHSGEGRCKFHGGASLGRPIIHGLYSTKLRGTIKDEYDKLINDPTLVDLRSELGVLKSILGKFIESINDKLDDDDFFIQEIRGGKDNEITKYEMSAQMTTMLTILDKISSLYARIVDAEQKTSKSLDVKYIHTIIMQIGVAVDKVCGDCPLRKRVKDKLNKVKLPT